MQHTLVALTRSRLARSSVRRFRASLSSFFAWAVKERMIRVNPVTATRLPKTRRERVHMRPFTETDLDAFHKRAAEYDQRLADVLIAAEWTGLRWSELREVRVRDFAQVPMPVILVSRAAPEGVEVKATKSVRSRTVPVADRVLPIVQSLASRRRADDLLFVTGGGHQLHEPGQAGTALAGGCGRSWYPRPTTYGGVSVARAASTRRQFRRGWGTRRSQRQTSTCTTWAPAPTAPGSTG